MSKEFQVCIDYKKSSSFSCVVEAVDQAQAERKGIAFAMGCGFTEQSKKITAKEITGATQS